MASRSTVRTSIISAMRTGRTAVRSPRMTAIRGADAVKSTEVNPLKALGKAQAAISKGAKNPAGTKFLG